MFTVEEVELLDKFLSGDAYDKKELDKLKKKVEFLNKRIKLNVLFEKQQNELEEQYNKSVEEN
jgi:hypothetical protein